MLAASEENRSNGRPHPPNQTPTLSYFNGQFRKRRTGEGKKVFFAKKGLWDPFTGESPLLNLEKRSLSMYVCVQGGGIKSISFLAFTKLC